MQIFIFVILRLLTILSLGISGYYLSLKDPNKYRYNFFRCVWPSYLIYTLTEGLRYNRGMDYLEYALAYTNEALVDTTRMSEGFLWLNRIMHLCDIPEPMIFCVYSLLTILLLSPVFYYYRRYALYLMPLFFLATILQSENLVRQYISISISFAALVFCIKNEKTKMMGAILLSFFFHSASLVFAPFILFANYWNNKRKKYKFINKNFCLFIILGVYLIPNFITFDYLNDDVLSMFFNNESVFSEYENYSRVDLLLDKNILEHSLVAQIKDWLMWGLLLYLGFRIKDSYADIGIPIVYLAFFVGSIFVHVLTDGTLFRINLYYLLNWFILSAILFYDYFKANKRYGTFYNVCFWLYVVIVVQSYLPALVVPTLMGCDFIWDI